MAAISHYQIKEYDTLESIASRFLNDPGRWVDIVQANNLRYPFISDDPKYQLGIILASGQIGVSLPAGSNSLTIQIPSPQLATAKGVLYIEQVSNTGRIVTETLTLSMNGQLQEDDRVTLFFTTNTLNSYDQYAEWSLFSNPILQTSKVAKTGDVLSLTNANFQDKIDTTSQFNALLGSDLSLDEQTRQLRWDSNTHDIALVSGVENLRQACYIKLMTNVGDLVYHSKFGNRLLQFIGAANTPVLVSMAPGLLRECILQDPRVFSVEDMTVSVKGDVLSADFRIRVRGIDTLVKVTSLGIELK